MLILTRCPGQGHKATICIGHDVEVTVLGIQGDQVQVAVTAPPSLSIACDSASPDACSPRAQCFRRNPTVAFAKLLPVQNYFLVSGGRMGSNAKCGL